MHYFYVMKIGYDAKRLFLNSSGLGNYSRYVIAALLECDPSLDLVLYTPRTSARWTSSRASTKEIDFPSSLRRFLSLNRAWSRDQIDIYHGLSNELPFFSSPKVKKVVTIHDLLFLDFPQDYPWLDRYIYHHKFKRAAQIADKIVAISQVTRREIIQRLDIPDHKVQVIYQSCDPAFFVPPDPVEKAKVLSQYCRENRPYILSVGTFSFRKNQAMLIRAYHDSGLASTGVDLVLVGKANATLALLRDEVQKLGLGNSVRFLTQVDSGSLISLVYGAQYVVYPSRKEGFGIPVLEALAAEKAVIVAEGTSCAEAGGEAVMTFDPLRVEELSFVMKQLMEDSVLRKKMESLGRRQVEKFSPSKEIPELIKLYKNLLQ